MYTILSKENYGFLRNYQKQFIKSYLNLYTYWLIEIISDLEITYGFRKSYFAYPVQHK